MKEIKLRVWIYDRLNKTGRMYYAKDFAGSNGSLLQYFEERCKKGEDFLMQYTGLKDKKRTEEFPEGQEICEGDIVKLDTPENPYHPTRNKEIIFQQEFTQFCVSPCTSISCWKSVEIIGNVHENPNLFEDK